MVVFIILVYEFIFISYYDTLEWHSLWSKCDEIQIICDIKSLRLIQLVGIHCEFAVKHNAERFEKNRTEEVCACVSQPFSLHPGKSMSMFLKMFHKYYWDLFSMATILCDKIWYREIVQRKKCAKNICKCVEIQFPAFYECIHYTIKHATKGDDEAFKSSISLNGYVYYTVGRILM